MAQSRARQQASTGARRPKSQHSTGANWANTARRKTPLCCRGPNPA